MLRALAIVRLLVLLPILVLGACSSGAEPNPAEAPCTFTAGACSPSRCYVVEGHRYDPDRDCVLPDAEPIGCSEPTLVTPERGCWVTADGTAYVLSSGVAPVGGPPSTPCTHELRVRAVGVEKCPSGVPAN